MVNDVEKAKQAIVKRGLMGAACPVCDMQIMIVGNDVVYGVCPICHEQYEVA